MKPDSIPPELRALFAGNESMHSSLEKLMPLLGDLLQCDRSLLFLRNPVTRQSCVTHQWSSKPEYTFVHARDPWTVEPQSLPQDDPMFAMALVDPVALYIEDVDTAGPEVLNEEVEKLFDHSALIHAPIWHEGGVYGILEPCVFGRPRQWSATDRAVTAWIQEQIAPLAVEYVRANCP